MTEAERTIITEAINHAHAELMELVHDWNGSTPPSLSELYVRAKPVHEAALGIWTAVVDVLRAEAGLPTVSEAKVGEPINLDELFP